MLKLFLFVGKIRVYVRMRPPSKSEIERQCFEAAIRVIHHLFILRFNSLHFLVSFLLHILSMLMAMYVCMYVYELSRNPRHRLQLRMLMVLWQKPLILIKFLVVVKGIAKWIFLEIPSILLCLCWMDSMSVFSLMGKQELAR